MALHPFITRGIVYDTEKQTAHLYQAVDRLTASGCEQYVVVDVFRTAQGEYFYTLIGTKTLTVYTTKFIFDTVEAEDFGFYADCSAPVILSKDFVYRLIARASDMAFDPEEELRPIDTTVCEESEQLLDMAYLSPKAQIVEYSDKCYAVFTAEEHDAELLQFIGAIKNDRLTWQGKKVSGWVVPKSRRERLAGLVK